jgi:hypothetical protein
LDWLHVFRAGGGAPVAYAAFAFIAAFAAAVAAAAAAVAARQLPAHVCTHSTTKLKNEDLKPMNVADEFQRCCLAVALNSSRHRHSETPQGFTQSFQWRYLLE